MSNEGSLGITRSYPPHAPLLLSICRIYEFSWPFSCLTFQKEPAHTDAAASQCNQFSFSFLFLILGTHNLFQFNSNVQLETLFVESCIRAKIFWEKTETLGPFAETPLLSRLVLVSAPPSNQGSQ